MKKADPKTQIETGKMQKFICCKRKKKYYKSFVGEKPKPDSDEENQTQQQDEKITSAKTMSFQIIRKIFDGFKDFSVAMHS